VTVLEGKTAVVTGTAHGIGSAIADALRADGAKVHAVDLDIADLTRPDAVRDFFGGLGGVDILVNNASGFGSTDDEAGWGKSLSVDLMATVRATQAATPFLEKSDGATILNISSTSAFHPSVRSTPYGVAKAAVIQYTKNRAAALAPQKIRVNCIAPGSIEFPGGSWEKRKTDNPQLYNAILRGIPFGRLGYPEEVAQVALFLASPLAGWVTGQTIMVDGGQTLGR
jgi:3-oxoacyl-[acyl-carrier protein] reductase